MITPRRRAALLAAAAVAISAVGVAVPAPLAAAVTGVDPSRVDLTLAPGASSTFAATVTTPVVAPNPDIVFLADTTGSMDPALANVRNNLPSIIDEVRAAQPTARFGVAEYKEQRDGARVFRVDAGLTDDRKAIVNGAQQWLYNVGGGGQPQTDFLNAQFQLANGAVTYRPSSTRVIAWFGDARSNDPSLGHTLAATVNSLKAQGIRVVAVPVTGTTAPGLDERGQATNLTSNTSGVLMPTQSASAVAAAILTGIKALTVPVTAVPTCDQQLTLTPNPALRTVRSGTAAAFTETVAVKAGTTGGAYRCTVDFQVNGTSVGYTQTVTVHVPGVQPVIRISDVTVDEGDYGGTPATLTVSLDRASTQQVTVGWSTVPGTADEKDFTVGSGTVTVPPGQTSAQVTVGVVGDTGDEPDETFTVRLATPEGATLGDADGAVTIRDDDEPVIELPVLRISDNSVPEADDETTGELTVSLDHASDQRVTVDWATAPGTAGSDDYVEDHGTLTFDPGQTSATVPVTVRGDDVVELDETFTVHLSNPTQATVDDADGVVTIYDEDDTEPGVQPTIRVGDTTGPEGNAGTTPATLTVVLDKPSATPITVQWTTLSYTANADDFVAAAGDLTFAPGEVSEQLTVQLRGDQLLEDRETFVVRLTGANIADDTAFVTIDDDDADTGPHPAPPPPTLRIGDVTVPEGNASGTPATVTVVLDRTSNTPVTVRWATADGTATAPGDYTAGQGPLTFAPGETTKQITVPVTGDRAYEDTETFAIGLDAAAGATITDATAAVTVTNDDEYESTAEVTIDDASVVEHAGPAVLTVRLSTAREEVVTLRLVSTDGSATAPADFHAIDETVTFGPGETLKSVPVEIVDDQDAEGAETFTVAVVSATGTDIADATGVVTIMDDDGEPGDLPVASVCDASGSEDGGTVVFPVRLTKPAAGEVTIHWTTTPGTANGDDFLAGEGDVRFAAGETTARIEIQLADDSEYEGDETFTLTLSAPAGATLGDAEATGVILDDDDHDEVTPSVSVSDTSVRENGGPAGFEVQLSEAASDEVTVEWTTSDGTAVSPADYSAGTGTVVFTPGQVSALVSVPVTNDTAAEYDETFTLTLSAPAGATVGDGTAVGTIVDDDQGSTTGGFTCTASAANLLGTHPAVANHGGKPCVDDTGTAAALKLGLGLLNVRVEGLTAATDVAPGGMSATAGLATTRISTVGLVIEIGAITSTATAACVAGPAGLTPSLSGSSSIAWLKVNGVPVKVGAGKVTVPLLVGSLTLNSTVAGEHGVTQRAFDLRTLVGNVVIGESTVGASGNPCP
jgi:hypothetical protein